MQFLYNERGELLDITNAQSGKFIYQRNPLNNLAKIQPQGNFWQMQKISYVNSFAKINLSICAFGDGFGSFNDGWGLWSAEFGADSGGGGCYDPFGGGGYGGSSFGGFGGFGGPETCEQCRARQHRICQSGVGRDIGYGTAAGVSLVGCLAAGTLAVVCVIVGGLFIAAGTAIIAYNNYNICEDQIIDNCPVCKQ